MSFWFGSGFIYARLNLNQYVDIGLGKRKGLHADFLLTHSFELRGLPLVAETSCSRVVFRFMFKVKEKQLRFVS